jgi:predicted peroxiredoxin
MARLLFVIAHSTDEPDRAATALATALAAAQAGHEVGLWLTGEGVRLGVAAVAETLREPGPLSAAAMLEALAAHGVRFHLDRRSFDRREFGEESLRAGASVAGAEGLALLAAEGWLPLPT